MGSRSGGVARADSGTVVLQQMSRQETTRLDALLRRLERAQLPDVADARADDGALEHDQHAKREQRVVPADNATGYFQAGILLEVQPREAEQR